MEQDRIDAIGREIARRSRASEGVIVPVDEIHLYLLVRKANLAALVEAMGSAIDIMTEHRDMVRADPGKTEDDVARVQGALDDADAALAKVDAP